MTEMVSNLRYVFILLAYMFKGWSWVTQFQSQEAVQITTTIILNLKHK